jgi:hypothetical protein
MMWVISKYKRWMHLFFRTSVHEYHITHGLNTYNIYCHFVLYGEEHLLQVLVMSICDEKFMMIRLYSKARYISY